MKTLLLIFSVFCCCCCLETTIEEATNKTITIGQLNSDYIIKRSNGTLTITTNNNKTITLRCDDVTSLVVRNIGLVTSCTRDYYVIELKRPMARTLNEVMMTWQNNDDVTNVKNWTLIFQGNKMDAVFDLDRKDQDMVSIPNGATYAYTRCVNSSDVIKVKEDGKSLKIYENSFTKCEEMTSEDLSCSLVVSQVCPGRVLMLMQMKNKISDHGKMLEFVDGRTDDVIRKFNITESPRNVRIELNGPTHVYKNANSSYTCNLLRGKASLRIIDNSNVVLAETSNETSLIFTTRFDMHTILSCEATQENSQIVAKSQPKEVRVYEPPHWKVKDEVCNLTDSGLGICKKTIIANPPALRGYLYNGLQPIERVDICSGVGDEQSFKLSKMQQFDPLNNYTLKLRTLIGESELDLHIVVRSSTTTSGPIEVPLVFLIILGVIICLQLALIFICYMRKQKYKSLVKEMTDDGTISFPRILVSSASSRDTSAASQVTKVSRNPSEVGELYSQRSSICTFNTEVKRLSTDRSSKGNIKYVPPSDYILPETCNESKPEEELSDASAEDRTDAIITTASSLKPIDKRKRVRRKIEDEKLEKKEEESLMRVVEDKQAQNFDDQETSKKSES